MAETPRPQPQRDDEPHTDPPTKTGYDVPGDDDEPPVRAQDDEPHTDPVKTGYNVQGD